MERVTFNIAKIIKEIGYPQSPSIYNYDDKGNLSDCWVDCLKYYAAPTYLELWIWMWNNTKYKIQVTETWTGRAKASLIIDGNLEEFVGYGTEDMIVEAINYIFEKTAS